MKLQTAAALALLASSTASAGRDEPPPPPLQLVETFPVETSLDDPEIPEAHQVWLEMIEGAQETLDIAQFYVVREGEEPTRLDPILDAIDEAAKKRKVRVRLLADAKFAKTYPEQLERLGARDGIEVRLFDMKPLTGGVLHAKYFIVDHAQVYLGSQNFDWRSLTHVQELGVRVAEPGTVSSFCQVFQLDWELAATDDVDEQDQLCAHAIGRVPQLARVDYGEGTVQILPVASPKELLPNEGLWDLPRILLMLEGAKKRIRVQLLTYATIGYDGAYWDEIDRALRGAAARGVEVEILVADWAKKSPKVEALQSLQVLPGITVKFVTIPEHSDGFIEFARVVHAKYLVVDGRRSWVGTSNWSRDYFHGSRNVGLVVVGEPFAADLDRYFERVWTSEYAEVVDPSAEYEAPRTH